LNKYKRKENKMNIRQIALALRYLLPNFSKGGFMRYFTVCLLFLLTLTTLSVVSRALEGTAFIPAGEYEMGDHHPEGHFMAGNQWAPVHKVYIDAFWMDIYETTNEEYVEYLNSVLAQGLTEVTDGVVHKAGDTENYCSTSGAPGEYSHYNRIHWDGNVFTVTPGKENHPFVQVTWYGAAAFANWRSAEAGLTPCYDLETWECDFDTDGFRLPTEAEWEKAARGGKHEPYYMYPWGSNNSDNTEGNFLGSGDPYEDEIPATTRVGYYDMANGYGLYDMAGNVWEWCNDWWDYDYPGESPYDNPRGPEKGVIITGGGHGSMYHHGFALLALSEAYGVVSERLLWQGSDVPVEDRRTIGQALELAVRCALTAQTKNSWGAWRYSPDSQDADTTVSGTILMGLLGARNAGIEIPNEAIEKAISFFRTNTMLDGVVSYQPAQSHGNGITRSAIGTLVYAVAKRKDLPEYKVASEFIKRRIDQDVNDHPFYYRYYMAQALFHSDLEAWKAWNGRTVERLQKMQEEDGSFASSHGKAYGTGMSVLALALNYRLLPVYER